MIKQKNNQSELTGIKLMFKVNGLEEESPMFEVGNNGDD